MYATRRILLHDEIRARLQHLIVGGELKPGSKIPERELCQRYGVSRTPLREAIKVLASEGLVRLELNRGAVVSDFTVEELQQTLPIAAAVKALAGELACQRVTDEEISSLRLLHDQMVVAYKAGDDKTVLAYGRKVRENILSISCNPLLVSICEMVSVRIRWTELRLRSMPELMDQVMANHETIMEAIDARQGAKLAVALRRHVELLFDAYCKDMTATEHD
jgi:DNA-binding GntR family transcriptional regulator